MPATLLPRCLCLATNAAVTYCRSHVKTSPMPPRGEAESRYESFASTRWSIVLEAGDSATVSAHAFNALSELCQIYWRPLYSFLRRQGCGTEDARDLIQGFFADLIETRAYARADHEKGRFRSFLLGTLKHYVADVQTETIAERRLLICRALAVDLGHLVRGRECRRAR